jgi:hypothetical protein
MRQSPEVKKDMCSILFLVVELIRALPVPKTTKEKQAAGSAVNNPIL